MRGSDLLRRLGLPPMAASLGLIIATAKAERVPEAYALAADDVGKFALVVGVEHYDNFRHVQNALNDGVAVGVALTKAGYALVRFLPDPRDADSILDAVGELLQQSDAANRPAVLTLYFAGHGFRTEYSNYIVPAAARADS